MRVMKLRKAMAYTLLFSVLMSCACTKKNNQTIDSVSPLSQYYITQNNLLSISHEIDAQFSDNNVFVQTYYESDEYWEAYRECCIPKIDDEKDKQYPTFPIDEQGKVITPENKLLILDQEGEIAKTYDLNHEFGTSSTSRKMVCCDDGCWMMSLQQDAFSGEKAYCIDFIHAKEGVTKHIDLEIDPNQISVLDFSIVEDGRFTYTCWANQPMLVLLNHSGKFEGMINLPEKIESNVVRYRNCWTCIGRGNNEETILFCYDENNKYWQETKLSVPVQRKIEVCGEDLFGISTNGIVWIDDVMQDSLAWEDVAVWGTIHDLRILDNGGLELLVRPLSEGLLVWYHLIPSDKQNHESSNEFVIAGYNLENSCVNQLIQDMSLRHPEIKFVMRDYKNEISATEENWAQARSEINTIMSLDLANGTAPDMYFDLYDDLGLEDMGRLGYLWDMTSLISKLDDQEYYVDKITMGEEIPYCACLDFDVIGFCASEDYVENPDTWTYEDFYRSAGKFTDLTCIQSIFSKQYLLQHVVMAQIDKYVQDGKANFDGEDFLRALKWTNDIGCRTNWDEYVPAELDNGLFMLDWADIVSLGSVIMYQDYVIVGFPNENGALHVVPYNILAVSATTSQTELASEIIEYAMGESFQSENYQLQEGISVNRMYCEQKMEQDYNIYSKMQPNELRYSKDEYFDMYYQIVSRGNHYLHGSQAIIDICLEEAAVYYSGDCSAEHAAEMIQDRVTIYLQETDS